MNVNKANIFAWFSVIVIPLMLGVLVSMFFVPFRVVEIQDMDLFHPTIFSRIFDIVIVKQPFEIIAEEHHGSLPIVYAGEPITIKYEYVKYEDIPTKYVPTIVCASGYIHQYDPITYHPKGEFINGKSTIADNLVMPDDLPPGKKCFIDYPTLLYVNQFKPVVTSQQTEYFVTRAKR